MHSYHIFYFPFKWKFEDRENLLFSEQVDLNNIPQNTYSNWKWNPECMDHVEKDELYNEQNYYYPFVHSVLYDDQTQQTIVKHFEHKDPKTGNVRYFIKVKGVEAYCLNVKAINLNLYATGVGMLNFYLENDKYSDEIDILRINQFGRRIFPPFMKDIELRGETAEYIEIQGLLDGRNYKEDFLDYTNQMSWKPACFIKNLIVCFSEKMIIEPVIDDRMFVNCTYSCPKRTIPFDTNKTDLSPEENQEVFCEFFLKNDFWYRYLFVDHQWPTCQNIEMSEKLLRNQTYTRWQRNGSVYGFSRYSLVLLMGEINQFNDFLPVHMRTMYSRMVEMVLIVRASILKFSNEISEVNKLMKKGASEKQLINRIDSLYKEYIRFVNQFYFPEVTAQDQGIELYTLMIKTLRLDDYVKDLDKEIEELHRYVMMLEERNQTQRAGLLNIIAMVFLPATLLAGLFNMAPNNVCSAKFWNLTIVVLVVAAIVSYIMWNLIKKRKNK